MSNTNSLFRVLGAALRLSLQPIVLGSEAATAVAKRAQGLIDDVTGQPESPSVDVRVPPDPAPAPVSSDVDELTLVSETISGLVAFVVPGPDRYSVAQGVTAPDAGGVDIGIVDVMIACLDRSQPAHPNIPPPSAAVTTLLNSIAVKVNPAAEGAFHSHFARLRFEEKAVVFRALEQDPAMAQFRRLASVLLFLPAELTYSEAGAYDFKTGSLTGTPGGWKISGYSGPADGTNEFKGYFGNRRAADA